MKKRGEKLPGYYMKKPMFPCIRGLRPLLGSQDAAIQTNEIALRYMEEVGNASETGLNNFLLNMADKYKISHGERDFEKVKRIIAQTNIVNTFNIIDLFFKRFICEYRQYKQISFDSWISANNGKQLDSLNQIYFNLPQNIKELIDIVPEFHLLNYYRLVRNCLVHIGSNNKKIIKYYEKTIKSFKEHFTQCYKLLPHSLGNLDYNDYFLYTRSVKYFANKLNDFADLRLEEIIAFSKKDLNFTKKLKGLENISDVNTKIRRTRVIKSYYIQHHAYGRDKILINTFLKEFKKSDKIKW